MAKEKRGNHAVGQALQQAIELLDDAAEWNRLYGSQIDRDRLNRIREQLDELHNGFWHEE